MKIISIDPGDVQSAYLIWDNNKIEDKGICKNDELREKLSKMENKDGALLAVEMMASYGMAVGKTIFDTCVWIGRFLEIWGKNTKLVYRQDVKMCLCHSMKAKDSNIRQALIDRFPATGGGKCPQIGNTKQPGPLFGVSADIWSALAIAMYVAETEQKSK